MSGRQTKKRGKKKAGKIFVLIIVILSAGILSSFFLFRVNKIEYIGGHHYSDDKMTEKIFGTQHPNALFYLLFGEKNKQITFVQKYEVDINWPNQMMVTVYEKPIVGYINYMGCNMFFDKDGIVVESSSEVYEHVPEIEGLTFSSIVLNSKLEVQNSSIFSSILDLTQSFNKYQLGVDKVYFDSSYYVTLYIHDIKVLLGNPKDCNDKIYALKQMEKKIEGLKGTLNLSDYNGSDSSVIFKKE